MADKPFTLKLAILPTDDVDMDRILAEIAARGLVRRYVVSGRRYLQIRSFARYQNPHRNEVKSEIPPPPEHEENSPPTDETPNDHAAPRNAPSTRDITRALATLPEHSGGDDPVIDPEKDPEYPPPTPSLRGGGRGRGNGHPKLALAHPDFEAFWEAYPRKVKRIAAETAWDQQRPDLSRILAALAWQKRSDEWQRESHRYVPYPGAYLNGRRWEDERPHEATGPPLVPPGYTRL